MRAVILPLLLLSITSASAQNKSGAQPPITPRQIASALKLTATPEGQQKLHDQIMRLFGRQNLTQGKAGAKIEATTVAWAVIDPKPSRVVQQDGTLIGDMLPLGDDGLQVLVTEMPNFTETGYRVESEGMPHMAGTVHVEHYEYTADSLPHADVPKGRLEKFEWSTSKVFPETVRDVTVYLPSGFQPQEETCLMVWQDGTRHADPLGSMRVPVVFDNLIHKKQMPRTVGIFIDPGRKPKQKPGDKAANRGFEYDSLGDAYSRMLIDEILPEVQSRYQTKFRPQPESWAIGGGSSGGICSFNVAWERPDKFRKVLSWVGSFVDLKGGHAYPSMIRLAERKPLRIYLLDGENDLDNKFGNWPIANKQMAAALKYKDYDFRIDWTQCFHGSKGMAPMLPEALRWLWRDVK
ncbi:alpha/beta hydrolase [Prosthecobacter vanneervenii]|uniref:Enterochelin esterase-like enzyme n=1 Tax=Prosthecobacter vanneervenii TaxID=48466 RepID=A0A7W7YCM7_9BACT|nr:alpha/beta hydrolase-fold protein [Prosthecobacter vanneervenii]MBB5033654.1 enterochelin esterase-like enzyme [Prosthecobacter vanneervenii]